MANFHKVRGNGCILVFPYTFPEHDRFRGSKGYVVDLDAPCEATWCKGQEHKLEPAPEAKAANPINHPLAVRAITAEKARLAAAAEKADSAPESELVGASTGESDPLEVKPARARKAS